MLNPQPGARNDGARASGLFEHGIMCRCSFSGRATVKMTKGVTDPMPLDGLPSGASARGPLRWLRARLFKQQQPQPPSSAGTSTGRGHALRKAHTTLQAMFAAQPALAQLFPHLRLLERALAYQGSQALRRIAAPLLQRALEQVEELQLEARNADLNVLRNRMIEELALRSVRAGAAPRAAAPVVDRPPATSPDMPDTDIGWISSAPASRHH
jgi:hypothetical protein